MPFTEAPPPVPDQDVQIIDPKTGKFTTEGRRYLVRLLEWLKRLAAAVP
jgi:hypothetical protein